MVIITNYLYNNKSFAYTKIKVTKCLTEHKKCYGRYSDYSGNFIIKCLCSCHYKLGVDSK